ncbi:hypothetical protein [Kribbella sp. VKM Ac-2568]|uniref:hypothetical protein n=1 Tax=Kribbella sp. VKM Ac-2568 TaxID=2512219 RepID=UPI00130543CA|nr:hypothetical protein [Kribbella sp. VKM Ac-2568]
MAALAVPPVLLMTLAIVPTPPSDPETRSWNLTPGVSGTSKDQRTATTQQPRR